VTISAAFPLETACPAGRSWLQSQRQFRELGNSQLSYRWFNKLSRPVFWMAIL